MSLVVNSCYKEELNRIKVDGGGEKNKNKLKKETKGVCWDSGDGHLPSKGNRRGKGELAFGGLAGVYFLCHSR